ncbi:MAG TPA: indole-3-glycerol phosphate synthase TrpC [Candidatus Omnitrophica bacterium]|nr:indole-3-glycerol phosphate synthase TrpC [Candidatus Omnitrophota bacterium]HBH96702.1 indole-3-glycerol phosphate synthase TrpC [Candidatus Omnitrophota bacterium]HBQ38904.1 indole-3-glycerol phosphate synthase TrpC [Candidatus Omnitrophota bacterium]
MLDEILAHKREEVAASKQRLPLEELTRRVQGRRAERDFVAALRDVGKRPALIAELKRRSPSKGMLRERFDPPRLAQELQEAGAAALSVLTDEHFFGGSLEFVRDAHDFTELPILRKDFLLEPYQVYEALSAQADAVLLIVQLLTEPQLKELLALSSRLGLAALVEIHAEPELDRALRAGATLIGINSRDLRDFSMHPETIERLAPKIPKGVVVIAESGVQSAADVKRLAELGVQAVLIGEALMTAPDVQAKVRELFQGIW